jgi:hypothetical protein
MAFLRRRGQLAVVALCVLAVLAGAQFTDYFHTDDGPRIDTHCLACQLQLNSTAVFTASLAALPPLEPVGTAVAPAAPALRPAPIHEAASRGPPSV